MNRSMLRHALSLLFLALFAWGDLGAPLADATAFHRTGRGPEAIQGVAGSAIGAARHLSACQLDTAWGTARTPAPTVTGAVVPLGSTRVREAVEALPVLLPRRSPSCQPRAPPAPSA